MKVLPRQKVRDQQCDAVSETNPKHTVSALAQSFSNPTPRAHISTGQQAQHPFIFALPKYTQKWAGHSSPLSERLFVVQLFNTTRVPLRTERAVDTTD